MCEGAQWTTALGGLVAAIGLALTVVSFLNPNQGSSFIFYGMIFVGGIWLVRGITRLRAIDELPPLEVEDPQFEDEGD